MELPALCMTKQGPILGLADDVGMVELDVKLAQLVDLMPESLLTPSASAAPPCSLLEAASSY